MYNTKEEFLADFQKWREQNGLPKREQCREMFREYRECELGTVSSNIFDYILEQEKPGMFLDSLFKKGNSVCDSDPKPEVEKVTQEPKKSDEDYKLEIINAFYAYAQENKSVPSFKVLNSQLGYKVQKYFQDEKDLYYACATVHDVQDYLLNESMFSPEYTRQTLDIIKQHKRFLISTAVAGKKCNKLLLKSMLNYCERKDAIILVLPSQDVFNRKSKFEFELDPELNNNRVRIVYEDTYLNENLYISDIKVSAKMLNPTMGLPTFTQDGSVIISSPKQELSYIANSQEKPPNAIMTTGAITEPNYNDDAYMSKRLSKIAENEHVNGALVVEISSNKIFHFRQLQMDRDGSICDLAERFTPDGEAYFLWNSALVIGDSHFGEHEEAVFEVEKQIIKDLSVKNIVLHDLFTANSISHHEQKNTVKLAQRAEREEISLEDEINMVARCLDEFSEVVPEKVLIPISNHHEHLDRYLSEGRYAFDKTNLRYSLDIVKAMIDGETIPLRYALENQSQLQYKDRLQWLEPDKDYDIFGVEISQHGSKGANGAKGNLQTYRKAYKHSVSAHNHSSAIYKGAYRVGTSSKLRMSYNSGLSSWNHSVCLIMEGGLLQLINIVYDGEKYTWKI